MNFKIGLKSATASVLLLGVLSTAAFADDAPVTIKYAFKNGDSSHQQMVMKPTGIDAVVKMKRKTTVKDVKDTGEFTEVITDEGGVLTLMGSDQDQAPGPEITVKRDKTGKMLDYKAAAEAQGALSPEVQKAMAMLNTIILPTMAVKANDTWKVTLDNPVYDKAKIKLTYTYIGTEKLDGVDTWKLKIDGSVPTDGDNGVIDFSANLWLKTSNGGLVKLDGNAKDVPTNFGKMTMSMVLSPITDAKPAPDTKVKPEIK